MSALQIIQSLTDQQLVELYTKCGSKTKCLAALGIATQDGRARQALRKRLGTNGIVHHIASSNYTAENIRVAFQTAQCWSDVYRVLNVTTCGHNKKAILRAAERHNISVPIFDVSKTYQRGKIQRTFENIFTVDSTASKGTLRKAVKQVGFLGAYKCSRCSQGDEWMGQPLTLELDHINGVSNDDRPENLRWLCLHCHSQTITYKGKNKKPGH